MMVVDTSALIAVLQKEPERDAFIGVIGRTSPVFASVVTIQEAAMVMFSRHGQTGLDELRQFLKDGDITILPYDEPQLNAAIDAFIRYGKGVNSKARLNLGDCASYALAKTMNMPLLFKGNDFTATDVVAVP